MRPRILPLDKEMQQLLTNWLFVRPDNGEPWVFLSKRRHDKLGKKGIDQVWSGDALDEDIDGGEPLDHSLHTHHHDIEERYRERIYELGL